MLVSEVHTSVKKMCNEQTEEFIDAVRRCMYLCDLEDPHYKDNVKKMNTWREIATQFRMKDATCPYCKSNWYRAGGRCANCQAAIDPGWSYCELYGVETARARRLKRAKQLSHRAKLQEVAHSELPSVPPHAPPPPKSPDLFGPNPTNEELSSIENSLISCCDSEQQSEKTLESRTDDDAMNGSDLL